MGATGTSPREAEMAEVPAADFRFMLAHDGSTATQTRAHSFKQSVAEPNFAALHVEPFIFPFFRPRAQHNCRSLRARRNS
jgi:hypothetical protein